MKKLSIVFAILVLLVTVSPAFAQSEDVETRLNLSHVCIIPSEQVEIEFVLVHPPDTQAFGQVEYFVGAEGGGQAYTTSGGIKTGDAVHYLGYFGGEEGTYIIDAHTNIEGVEYTLANAGEWEIKECEPTNVEVASFFASEGNPEAAPKFLAIALFVIPAIIGFLALALRRKTH
jgi:hypothetical protein